MEKRANRNSSKAFSFEDEWEKESDKDSSPFLDFDRVYILIGVVVGFGIVSCAVLFFALPLFLNSPQKKATIDTPVSVKNNNTDSQIKKSNNKSPQLRFPDELQTEFPYYLEKQLHLPPEDLSFTFGPHQITAKHIQPGSKSWCFGSPGSAELWEKTIIRRKHRKHSKNFDPLKQMIGTTKIQRFCLPDFIISGMPTSGTSAMFKFLCSHPQVNCPKLKEFQGSNFVMDLHNFPSYSNPDSITGAAMWSGRSGHWSEENPPPDDLVQFRKPKSIVLLRKPDEWIYSAFNFWCRKELEGNECNDGGWAKHDARSAERFHNLVTGKNCSRLLEEDGCPLVYPFHLTIVSKMRQKYGKENVLIVPTEKLYSNGYETMQNIFKFLEVQHFGDKTMFNKAVNTKESRGLELVLSHDKGLGNGGEPMFDHTRTILRQILDYDSFVANLTKSTGIDFADIWKD